LHAFRGGDPKNPPQKKKKKTLLDSIGESKDLGELQKEGNCVIGEGVYLKRRGEEVGGQAGTQVLKGKRGGRGGGGRKKAPIRCRRRGRKKAKTIRSTRESDRQSTLLLSKTTVGKRGRIKLTSSYLGEGRKKTHRKTHPWPKLPRKDAKRGEGSTAARLF